MAGEMDKRYLSLGHRRWPLVREKTDVPHKQMVDGKGKGELCFRMRCLILMGHVN